MPLISVVIPAFNREKSITDCINSVLNQSFSDFEIIVVDDGSSDNTAARVKEFSDARVNYFYQDNAGGSKARNTGILAARGKYIAFLDSDDQFLPFHLERALSDMNSGDTVVSFSQIKVDRGGEIFFLKPPASIKINQHVSEYLLADRGFIQTSTLVLPTALAKETLFDEKLKYGQDTDFAIRISQNGGSFIMRKDPSVLWDDKWNEKRVSSKIDFKNRIEWLNRVRSAITDKAYYADLGWPVAKGLSSQGYFLRAFSYYVRALLKGCYSFKLAVVIFLQIFLTQKQYRKLSDFLAKKGIGP